METLCGADAINVYVECGYLEQMFLKALPQEYIGYVLQAYSEDSDDLIINLASILVRNILGCRIAAKQVDTRGYTEKEQERIQKFVDGNTTESLEQKLQTSVDELMIFLYHGNVPLGDYLKNDMHDFSFELKNAVANHCLGSILAINN